ncbi:uncharacterized protein [Spinacia oleracea]|uniref:Uncharacterized protein isoform X5 n=1 Tax=Spinacia oleracea TaxID=3562 RepID=A0A9R0IP16_SPIOL|nr:uncharacterized protein LOC110792406 isoform X5 [Spinacia oleracea]
MLPNLSPSLKPSALQWLSPPRISPPSCPSGTSNAVCLLLMILVLSQLSPKWKKASRLVHTSLEDMNGSNKAVAAAAKSWALGIPSVAHMPWHQMTYKFLNTIIDDLFAFVIKMPKLHRLSVFRDECSS